MSSGAVSTSLKISSVVLTAANPGKLAEFYREALGFVPDSGAEDERIRLGVGAEASLILEPGAPGKPTEAGLFHVAYRYSRRSGLARALRRLLEQGVALEGASDHDVSEALYLSDPEGNGIELTWDRPREQWPYDNGTLVMSTRPLDLESLLRADDVESPETGRVPEASVDIGHIHFRVADLTESEEFWTTAVGLDVTVRYGQVASFLSLGGYHHHVGINRFAPWSRPEAEPAGVREVRMTTRSAECRPARLETPDGVAVVID